MGREHKKTRAMNIKQQKRKRIKFKKLKEKYLAAKNESEKEIIWEKINKISPELKKE